METNAVLPESWLQANGFPVEFFSSIHPGSFDREVSRSGARAEAHTGENLGLGNDLDIKENAIMLVHRLSRAFFVASTFLFHLQPAIEVPSMLVTDAASG
jgi:hypothetical protein